MQGRGMNVQIHPSPDVESVTSAARVSVSTGDYGQQEISMETKTHPLPPAKRLMEMSKLLRDIADGWVPNPKKAAQELLDRHAGRER